MAKKYSRITKTDQNIPQTDYRKTWYRQKTITFEQLLQISVHEGMKSKKRGTF